MTALPPITCGSCDNDQHHLARHDLHACTCTHPRCKTDDEEGRELVAAAERGFLDTFHPDESAALFGERIFDLGREFPIEQEGRYARM